MTASDKIFANIYVEGKIKYSGEVAETAPSTATLSSIRVNSYTLSSNITGTQGATLTLKVRIPATTINTAGNYTTYIDLSPDFWSSMIWVKSVSCTAVNGSAASVLNASTCTLERPTRVKMFLKSDPLNTIALDYTFTVSGLTLPFQSSMGK